jgi:FHA domain
MIWIEVLSRHREVTARFRIVASEARIGRGYDNDIIVDDPYVAASHLRIFRDEMGQWSAEDLGSANGTFIDGTHAKQSRFAVDGSQPIRIGHTLLRVREANHAVEPERLAPRDRPALPVALSGGLAAIVLGLSALTIWLGQTSEARASSYLTPLLSIIAAVSLWTGLWALLSRIFSGRSRFLRNLLIALAGILALTVYNEFARYFAFAINWPSGITYQYVAAWTVLAAICFLHLREIGPARLWLKGAIVTTVLATAIAAQTLQRSEAFSDFGPQNNPRLLMPPALRVVPVKEGDVFFRDVGELKARLDADRGKARAGEAGR